MSEGKEPRGIREYRMLANEEALLRMRIKDVIVRVHGLLGVDKESEPKLMNELLLHDMGKEVREWWSLKDDEMRKFEYDWKGIPLDVVFKSTPNGVLLSVTRKNLYFYIKK